MLNFSMWITTRSFHPVSNSCFWFRVTFEVSDGKPKQIPWYVLMTQKLTPSGNNWPSNSKEAFINTCFLGWRSDARKIKIALNESLGSLHIGPCQNLTSRSNGCLTSRGHNVYHEFKGLSLPGWPETFFTSGGQKVGAGGQISWGTNTEAL